uniref:Jerky protein homolog isoform X2 n=1 Tax=Geotrypetes seraphini TaxID=260995 RepID=A0A6P8QMQ9_GEOSA|nr:jerky protein homolog isoform X2 [Geotrypetes seraphini]
MESGQRAGEAGSQVIGPHQSLVFGSASPVGVPALVNCVLPTLNAISPHLHKWFGSEDDGYEVPVTFEDIALYFSQEEWEALEEWQKELYKDVMKENYQILLSLGIGSLNVTPDIISHIERGEEPYIRDELRSEERDTGKSSCSGADASKNNNAEIHYWELSFNPEGKILSKKEREDTSSSEGGKNLRNQYISEKKQNMSMGVLAENSVVHEQSGSNIPCKIEEERSQSEGQRCINDVYRIFLWDPVTLKSLQSSYPEEKHSTNTDHNYGQKKECLEEEKQDMFESEKIHTEDGDFSFVKCDQIFPHKEGHKNSTRSKILCSHPTPSMPKQVPSKRKRVVLTLKQKMEICKRLAKGESRVVLMKEFNIGSSTIYDIKAQSQKIKEFYVKSGSDQSIEKRHTLHTPKMETLDQALYEWFLLKRSEGECISGSMLQEKAREFHEKMNIEGQCSFSSGWLNRFKARHGICKLDLSSERKLTAASFRDMFREFVVENGLTPEQVYNANETELMWKCLPNSTLVGGNEKVAHGFKLNKERIIVLVCANASGNHKVKLSVIGKFPKPRCLKGITNLPVDYHTQSNSWMDPEVFTKWFQSSFVPSVKENLRKKGIPENSKVLLLLDNCRTHPPAEELVNGNIFVCYLPVNVTSLIQPMDQGVIQNVKMFYMRDFMQKMSNFDGTVLDFQKKYNLKDALYAVSCAWDSVRSETLRKCWRKLWPAVRSVDSSPVDIEGVPSYSAAASSRVYDEICELVGSANDNMDLSRDELNNGLSADEAIPVTHTLNTDDIIEAVVNHGKMNVAEEQERDDDACEVEKVSWQRAAAAFETVIAFAEQQPFFTSQHVMQLQIMQNLTLHERFRALKQAAHRFASTASSVDPKPSTSISPDSGEDSEMFVVKSGGQLSRSLL